MKRILQIAFCLLSLAALGQGLNVSWNRFVHQQSDIQNPLQISGYLFRWYVATDIPANVVVSNQWNDRIVSDRMWQMDTTKSPTNGPAGVRFSGTQSVTNNGSGLDVGNLSGCGGCDTFFFIFTPDGSAGFQGLFTDSTLGNIGPFMVATDLKYAGNTSGGPNTICTFGGGTTNDVVVRFTSTNTIWFTNGIAALTNSTVGQDGFEWGRIGLANLGFYKGSIFEVGYYTNHLFTPSQAASFHRYATNQYHYSP